MGTERSEGRGAESPRTIEVTQPLTDTLPGSVLYRCGRTEILCVASLEDGVPSWREDGLGGQIASGMNVRMQSGDMGSHKFNPRSYLQVDE